MVSPETIATNSQEEAEREVPVLERAEQSISPEEQVKQAMKAAEAAKEEFDSTKADAEMARDRSGYAERLSASPESVAEADEAIAGDLSAIRAEEAGLLEKLNAKLKKYAGVAGLAVATAGPAAAMKNPTDGFQSEPGKSKIVEVVPGDALPKPDIPKVFQMDMNLSEMSDNEVANEVENGIRSEKSELSDPMKEFSRLLGVSKSEYSDIDVVMPTDPIVLRLARELEDPEGVFKEGEIVMEGYEGFTEKQLRSLQKLSELADREFSFVFSRDGDGKFGASSREKDGRVSAKVNVGEILGSLQKNQETVHIHTHPAKNSDVLIPSLTDLTVDAYLRQVSEQHGFKSDNYRSVVAAPHGLWEYSIDDPYKPKGKALIEFARFDMMMDRACYTEIKRLRLDPEQERELRDTFNSMTVSQIVAAQDSSWEAVRFISREVVKKNDREMKKFSQSQSGKLYVEYERFVNEIAKGETREKRAALIQWGEENGIHLKFTSFPKNIAGDE